MAQSVATEGSRLGNCLPELSSSHCVSYQATEGIIKHLENVDAEPEDDDFMKEDETTDFTLFEVIWGEPTVTSPEIDLGP